MARFISDELHDRVLRALEKSGELELASEFADTHQERSMRETRFLENKYDFYPWSAYLPFDPVMITKGRNKGTRIAPTRPILVAPTPGMWVVYNATQKTALRNEFGSRKSALFWVDTFQKEHPDNDDVFAVMKNMCVLNAYGQLGKRVAVQYEEDLKKHAQDRRCPALPGTYIFRSADTDYEAEAILVTQNKVTKRLNAQCPYLRTTPIEDYHNGLTNPSWEFMSDLDVRDQL